MEPTSILIIGGVIAGILLILGLVVSIREERSLVDERLEYRRQTLYQQFYAMEEALGLLNSESSYLTQQLDAINANWKALNKD